MKITNEGKEIDFYIQKRWIQFKAGETKNYEEFIVKAILEKYVYWRFRLKKEDIAYIKKTADSVIIVLTSGKEIVQHKPDELAFERIRRELNPGKIQVGIFMKNTANHYSGGRYWAWLLGHILAQEVQVTFVTNVEPPFGRSFDCYGQKNVKIYIDKSSVWELGMKIPKNIFDYVIGIPMEGGVSVQKYAAKWDMVYYLLCLETPNFIRDYRSGSDSHDVAWRDYRAAMGPAEKVISNTEIGKKYLDEWMGAEINRDHSTWAWNTINTKVADRVKIKELDDGRVHIVFVGRTLNYKRIPHIIRAVNLIPEKNFVFHLISGDKRMVDKLKIEAKKNVQVEYHDKIDDYEKFKIIKESNMMVFPSSFEGFGLPPMEALYCERICIAYELPILKLIYKDHLIYVKSGDVQELAEKIRIWSENTREKKDFIAGAKEYINEVASHDLVKKEYFRILGCSDLKKVKQVKKVFVKTDKKKLTFGMIVCNGEQFISHSLKHVYDYADEIIIVEGAVEKFASIIGSMTSTDQTVNLIKEFISHYDLKKKIKLISSKEFQKPWQNKVEMQNVIASYTTGEYFIKQDVDEFYDMNGLLNEIDRLEKEKGRMMINYRSHHFWGDLDHVIVGANFNDKQTRVWKWKSSYRHVGSINIFVDTTNNVVLSPTSGNGLASEDTLFHYSYLYSNRARKSVLEYYHNRGLGDHADVRQAWICRDIKLLQDGRTVKKIEVKHPFLSLPNELLNNEVLQEVIK